ncbi:hypothetical protein CDD83_3848 [Cordyceps sp. RAO-2017]|nr:hypothetical protein CDD83_3848 [Cordyceps sp. RAO-2017]
MSATAVSVEYLATGANRQTAVADWSEAGLLAFGAGVNVAIWQPDLHPPRGIEKILSGHRGTVKAVKFLPGAQTADGPGYLVTGADDKTLVVWKSEAGGSRSSFGILDTFSENGGAVNCITALRPRPAHPQWVLATGAADATVRIWSFESDRLQLLQTIQTAPKYFPLALSLAAAPGGSLVLAAAGTRDTIQILAAETETEGLPQQFRLQATLTGHEGWIRSLDFARESGEAGSDLLLASASQDKYVRIWRIHQGRELPALAAAGAGPSSDAFLPGRSPSNKAHRISLDGKPFSVTFEALLLGHEDWIYSARWHAHPGDGGRLQLLSTSADNSLAIWEADASSGIWVSLVRLGEISREKGATTATGSTGGFWTGLWSPDGTSVACLGRTGSWRRWQRRRPEEDEHGDGDTWRPCIAVSGHTKAVTGIAWSKKGDYLLSTGADQTTRLHARWTEGGGRGSWHEMSRPQIHGYDLNCIDSLGESHFVSGADEKLMRVFRTPRAVAAMLGRLAGVARATDEPEEHTADAADMPVLGLSNKAVDAAGQEEVGGVDGERDGEPNKSPLDADHPPLEETLSRQTLWPETEKLYGHGYELSCLAASHDGRLVASACKASSINHAVIRLFETRRWTELRPPLTAHALTTTRLRFSSDDAYLLSVGRDRQWAVFERRPEDDDDDDDAAMYRPLAANPRGHARMLLDAAWAPHPDDDDDDDDDDGTRRPPIFATAGRDKQVRIWAPSRDGAPPLFAQTAALPPAG